MEADRDEATILDYFARARRAVAEEHAAVTSADGFVEPRLRDGLQQGMYDIHVLCICAPHS